MAAKHCGLFRQTMGRRERRRHRPLVRQAMLVLAALGVMMTAYGGTERAHAESCPPGVANALRLVMVSVADANAPMALLETFERATPGDPWRSVGPLRPAVVGKYGVAWGAGFREMAAPGEPLKREGDLRSPMGIYALGATFGFDQTPLPGHMTLAMERHVCVEEPKSKSYGRIVDSSEVEAGVKYDQMAAEPLYRKGMVVDYPADAANMAGSCIFIHVWREPGKGTAGCVALDENDVMDLRAWASETPSAIAILTADAKGRFKGCLPGS